MTNVAPNNIVVFRVKWYMYTSMHEHGRTHKNYTFTGTQTNHWTYLTRDFLERATEETMLAIS